MTPEGAKLLNAWRNLTDTAVLAQGQVVPTPSSVFEFRTAPDTPPSCITYKYEGYKRHTPGLARKPAASNKRTRKASRRARRITRQRRK